jgi:ABC-type multidrug transport system fused ATPase/permease subunit|tara:strand:+ start:4594 stop:5100 length:507 start_codon:yes stop_codon:yes gene_type:complete
MPADDYDARALALPLSDEETGETPVWSRRSTSSFRRNPSHHGQESLRQRIMTNYDKLNRRVLDQYNKLTPVQKVLFVVGNIALAVLGILFLIYNEKIFGSLLPVAKKWRDVRAGWLILWALIFTVSFPPLIGYSSLLTIAGFVYGFPNGYASMPLVGIHVLTVLTAGS